MMSVIGPVQSNPIQSIQSIYLPLSCGSPVGKRSLKWEGFVENVGFESGVKEYANLTVSQTDGQTDRHRMTA